VTIVIALLGLSFLIVVHELGHMLTARAMGVKVTEFAVGFGPPVFRKRFGKTVYSLRILLLGGFVKMAGMNDDSQGPDTYPSKPPWRRALIIFAGPFVNLVVAVLIFAGIFMFSGIVTGVEPVVDEVEPKSLAADVGIRPGDKLVGVDGEEIGGWQGFIEAVGAKEPGQEVSVTVERGGSERTFTGDLGADPENPDRALVGVRPVVEKTTYGPMESLGMAVGAVWDVTVRLVGFMGELVTGRQSFYDNVTGPVGIASVGSTSVEQGFFLPLLALISLNLAIFNLLPILPLDGGHLFFILAEKVMGRPVSAQTMAKIAAFGVALVLVLFLFATYADLSKLFTGQPFIPE
jgi:regulator of sigma E protease